MEIAHAPERPQVVLKKGHPDPRRVKAALRRILEAPAEPKLKGKTTEQIVQMARATREQIWKEKLAPRP
jgi:hypothetical protein